MAYEKYIKKDGKLYGPYIYHSKRVDGKVISEYHGQKQFEFKKSLWLIPLVALIILGAYFIGQRDNGATGYAILDLNANYQEDKPLSGSLKFSLQEGELVPAESLVVFENAGQKHEYSLAEIVAEKETEGNFYIKNSAISGNGSGFGILGEKEIYPEISFIVLVYSKAQQEEDVESEREVSGSASLGDDFTLILEEGERAELKPRSVKTGEKQLEDSDVQIEINENEFIVSTSYSEKEKGFGEEYLGEKEMDITIELGNLGLLLEQGNLRIAIIYNDKEIASMETIVGQAEISAEETIETSSENSEQDQETNQNQAQQTTIGQPEPAEVNTAPNETSENISITIFETNLTKAEREVLIEKFGNFSLDVSKAKEKNGFIIVRHGLGDFWIEYSYSSDISNEALNYFIETDKIKFLKGIAQSFLQPEETEKEIIF